MAYVSPSNKSTGDVVTAAHWNQDVVANSQASAPDIFTTAGDIAYATGADAAARLALSGTQRTVLEAGAGAPAWGAAKRPVTNHFMGAAAEDHHTESGNAVVNAGSSTAVTFADAFGSAPAVVTGTDTGAAAPYWSAKSTTGVTLHNQAGGQANINWIAEGAD